MMIADNTSDAFSSEKATQFYWGTSAYKSFIKDDGVTENGTTTYTWSADTTNVADWNTSKALSINNKYPGIWTGVPSTLRVSVKIDDAEASERVLNVTSNIPTEDGVIATGEKTTSGLTITATFVKDNQDILLSIDMDYGDSCTVQKIAFTTYVKFDSNATSNKSTFDVNVGESGNGSGSEQYVLGDPHSLTVNVSGMKAGGITLIDMGNRMDLIAGHETGEHIVSPDSIVTSRVARENNTVIQSGSNVQSGTFVGIYAEAPFMEDGKAGTITITCGQTTIGYYYISNASDSLKQCLFRMPDGDAVVSIVYNTAHVTFHGDNGSVVAKRNVNNVWYQDEYFFEGETVALTATADNGYLFDSFEVESGEVSITNGTFVVGDSDIVIAANFVEKEYNISITQATGGTVTSSKLKAKAGEAITLSVTTSKGYSLTSLSSLQIPSMTKDTRSFDMPASDVSITVEYEQMAQLSCTATQSSGMTILDVTVAANIGAGMEDPVFLIAGTYDGDIVVNAYSHIKTGTNHIERVSFSSYGLQEIFVQLVEGISSDPTGYFCVYTVEVGA